MGRHVESYRKNQAYTDFLDSQDPRFFDKYADTLRPDRPEGRVLDVGCGTGQVVARLSAQGYDAWGVEVSETSVQKARSRGLQCLWYDGSRLPFDDASFDAVGAFNVLEHVETPEAFIADLLRVLRPGGKLVLSSPNFYRVLGFRDYHREMRGIRKKVRHLFRLLAKWYQIRRAPETVRFDRMEPIWKEPFEPDDDAIVATNPLEMSFFVRRYGGVIDRIECTDRYVPRWIDRLLNAGPWRYLMFNVFLVAHKSNTPSP